jgi:hypothetical protein
MKKVADENTIGIDSVENYQMVYGLKGDKVFYKLHHVSNTKKEERYAFISMTDSISYSSGDFATIKEAIKEASKYNQIVVLDDISELKNYL